MVSSLEKALNNYFKNLESCHADVGFIDSSKTYPDGLNVPTVAFMQEYGVKRFSGSKKKKEEKPWFIPPRPFMSYSSRLFEPKFSAILKKELVSLKFDSKKAIDKAAKELQADIKESILNWSTPRNAPYTIELKGFDDPLVETLMMTDSVEYKVSSGISND